MIELRERVIAYNTEVKGALQAVYNDLNHDQRKKTATQSCYPCDV